MYPNILVTGISGSGKSFLADRIAEKFNVKKISKSNVMETAAKDLFPGIQKDDIKYLGKEDLEQIHTMTEASIFDELSQPVPHVIDDHLAVLVDGIFWKHAPANYLDSHNIGIIIVLEPGMDFITQSFDRDTLLQIRHRPTVMGFAENEREHTKNVLQEWSVKRNLRIIEVPENSSVNLSGVDLKRSRIVCIIVSKDPDERVKQALNIAGWFIDQWEAHNHGVR